MDPVAAAPVAEEEEEYCVVTGTIARNLLPKPTYKYDEVWTDKEKFDQLTHKQKYELSVPYAKIMATRLKGKPLNAEHDEHGGGPIGEILHSWVDESTDEWNMQTLVDRKSRTGNDMIKAMLEGVQVDGVEQPEYFCEFSLGHEGLMPVEVSYVLKGARDGCKIKNIEFVKKERLEAIKNQEYNMGPVDIPDHFPADTPRIAATFFKDMSTYTALRNPTAPVTYATQAYAPSSETAPILSQVEQMRLKNQQQQQAQQQQQQPPQGQVTDEIQRELQFLRAQVAQQKQANSGQHVLPQNGQPQTPAQQQFSNLTQKLEQPAAEGDPRNTGNVHTMHANPDDDKLMQIAGAFEGHKILSNAQKQEASTKLLEVAASTKATRDALAAKEAELEQFKKRNQELEEKVNHHEGDLERQRKQTAAMLKKIMIKTNPPPTQNEEKDLNTFEDEYAKGRTDSAMKTAQPFIIRASAFLDAAEARQSMDVDMQASSGGGGGLMQAMAQILQPNAPLVQGSAFGGRQGQKRSYETATAAASSNGGSIWRNDSTPYLHPGMAAMMQRVEEQNGGDDTIRRGDLETGRKTGRF